MIFIFRFVFIFNETGYFFELEKIPGFDSEKKTFTQKNTFLFI
jgi:hypothetical protein